VEFDTHKNVPFDTSNNHVSIVTGSRADTAVATAPAGLPLFGTPFRGTVKYDAATKMLKVYVNSLNKAGGGALVLSKQVDLPAILGQQPVFAGFTGSTGSLTSVQDVQKWSLTVNK
jgi:hypothetical protein